MPHGRRLIFCTDSLQTLRRTPPCGQFADPCQQAALWAEAAPGLQEVLRPGLLSTTSGSCMCSLKEER